MKEAAYRILIAEDESLIAAFLEKGLRKHGFETVTVFNGNDVIHLLEQTFFDLLLLDLGLPGKDGLLVLDELRQSGKTLPIVIVTAREGDASRVESLNRGANDYITKPFRFNQLLEKIDSQLGRSQLS